MKYTKFFGLMLCVATMSFVVPATAQDVPDANTVIEQHIKSLGGREKLESIKTCTYSSELTIDAGPGGKMNGEVEVFQKGNNFWASTTISTPQGDMEILQGAKDDVAWTQNPMGGGHQLMDEDTKRITMENYGHIFPALSWSKYEGEIKNVGVEKVGDTECYKLVFQPKEGKPTTRFFNKENGQMLKVAMTQKAPMVGEMEMAVLFEDFKEVDGVTTSLKQVTEQKTQMGVMNMEMTMIDLSYSKAVEDSKFELPEQIKEMVEKKKEKADK